MGQNFRYLQHKERPWQVVLPLMQRGIGSNAVSLLRLLPYLAAYQVQQTEGATKDPFLVLQGVQELLSLSSPRKQGRPSNLAKPGEILLICYLSGNTSLFCLFINKSQRRPISQTTAIFLFKYSPS